MKNQELNESTIPNSHFNTTNESGNQLEKFEQIAKNQELMILKLMQLYNKLSASDVWKYYNNLPITSVRRALSNLRSQGKLIKSNDKKIGIYGRGECYYECVLTVA